MGPDKQSRRAAIRVLFAATVGLISGCRRTPDEQQIRAQLDRLQAAVEKRSAGDFVALVTHDFAGSGGVDRETLRRTLAGLLLGSDGAHVTWLGPASVELNGGERATVTVDVLAIGGRWLPENGQRFHIVSGWRREDGEWRCYSARWNDDAN
jgi:hypothetical protein